MIERSWAVRCRASALILLAALFLLHPRAASAVGPVTQGWDETQRQSFYTLDQGSRIIPYAWFGALRRADGDTAFAADGLARFGYLPNPRSAANPEGLPVGFMIGNDIAAHGKRPSLAVNCSACHTRELLVDGKPMRIDGGPAITDFYGFLHELDAAVFAILKGGGDFDGFAHRVLGSGYSDAAAASLRVEVTAWYADFGPFIKAALPDRAWGPARLDAFGMIFNRVSGLDLGIPDNIAKADAPVRYPFIWNAPFQDRTQWPGKVPNGLFILGLGRNLGEEYGVFGRFSPRREGPIVRFNGAANSADFVNLQTLETLVTQLAAPKYPLPIDEALAKRGEALFVSAKCMDCHWQRPGKIPGTWMTPVTREGTDSRMFDNAGRKAKAAGILEGVAMPQLLGHNPLAADPAQVDLLGNAVGNTLLQELTVPRLGNGVREAVLADLQRLALLPAQGGPGTSPLAFAQERLKDLFNEPVPDQGGAAYEARVLSGIWAVAPYLHNGSVPTLWALLQKPADRPMRFMLGSNRFDAKNVGLATDASPFGFTFEVSPCEAPGNGNGNCGHLWGTELSEGDKWALIEYLKEL
jgi:hypothetical protein